MSKKVGLEDLLKILKEEGINPNFNVDAFNKDYERQQGSNRLILLQVLTFLGALLGAGFFLLFLAVAGGLESEAVLLFLGVLGLGLAVAIPYISKENAMVEPLALAILIVGGGLFMAGLGSLIWQEYQLLLWIGIIVSGVILVVSASHLQKVSAVLTFNCFCLALVTEWRLSIGFSFLVLLNAAVITTLWLKETAILEAVPKLGQWYAAIVNGCSISMLGIIYFFMNLPIYWYEEDWGNSYYWMSSILLVALVVWVLYEALDWFKVESQQLPILIGTALAMFILVKAPGIIAGILLLLLGLLVGYYLFVIQGIVAIFFFTVLFYYNLNSSLLMKSALMIGAGVLLGAMGYGLKQLYNRENLAE